MIWLLILLSVGGLTIQSVEFNDETACQYAKQLIDIRIDQRSQFAWCVEKGKSP